MSDTDTPAPEYSDQIGHKYPVEEHLRAQTEQTNPNNDLPLHPDAAAAHKADVESGSHDGGTE